MSGTVVRISSEQKHYGMMMDIESMLQGAGRDELVAMVAGLAREVPGVARWVRDRVQLESGSVGPLVCALQKEIRGLTSLDAWSDYQDCGESLPDYSHVELRFRALLERGHADAVLDLGRELLQRGTVQVSNAHDEGETAMGISDCMRLVLKALPDTRRSKLEQLSWLFEALYEDECELLSGVDDLLHDARYTAPVWHDLGVVLEERLRDMSVPEFDRWRERDLRTVVVRQLMDAYRRAGEGGRIIPLLEAEADATWEYDALVSLLLEADDTNRARHWCREGYMRTFKDAPGIAAKLQRRLRELAEMEEDWLMAAAYREKDFFERPGVEAFRELHNAAEGAGVWPAVRDSVLGYLLNGRCPAFSGTEHGAWVLPEPETGRAVVPESRGPQSFPNRDLLIEIAIYEKRNDDAIALYRDLCGHGGCYRGIGEQVADAVAVTHPDLSLSIWRLIIDNLIGEVKPKAYMEASGSMLKMQRVYRDTGQEEEWTAMLKELRLRHKAKRRLMEVLNEVEKSVEKSGGPA